MPSRQVPRSRGKPMWGQRLSSAYTCPAECQRTRVRPVTCTVLHPRASRSWTVATRCQLVRVEGWDSRVIAVPPGIGKTISCTNSTMYSRRAPCPKGEVFCPCTFGQEAPDVHLLVSREEMRSFLGR